MAAPIFMVTWHLLLLLQEHSTPNMTGQKFHRATDMIPRRPWKPKSPFASTPTKINRSTGTQRVRARCDAVLPPFIPSYGPPVVQSYWSPKHLHAPEILRFRGGSIWGAGAKGQFYFYGCGDSDLGNLRRAITTTSALISGSSRCHI